VTPDTRAFEFSLGLFAVLIGLAVADIATSFHKLVRSGSVVKWDPLVLLTAVYALCLPVCMWFDLWGVRHFAGARYFLFYLTLVAELFILFLIAAASLPDEAVGTTDLRDYYASNRRYFWSLVSLFQAAYIAHGFYFGRGELSAAPAAAVAFMLAIVMAPLAISLVLASVNSRVVHYAGVALLFVVMLLHYAPASIN
jgi:hypothetical protein